MKAIINGRLILPDANGNFKTCASVVNFDDKIISISAPVDGAEIFDAAGAYVAPGFINVHIHGAAGVDAMDDDPDALQRLADFLPTTGVTSFLPTTMTMPIDKIHRALERVRAGLNFSRGARILGAHWEGSFINKKFCGAQDTEHLMPADFDLIKNFVDVIKIITVAPEVAGLDFISRCLNAGIVVSIGHSGATYEQAMTAIERGASRITHLFNAQTGLHHRKPGVVGAALDSDANVELIADNVHVSPAAQRIVAKCKPRSQIILITDSMRACASVTLDPVVAPQRVNDSNVIPAPEYVSELGGQKVFVKGNLATLADASVTLDPVVAPQRVNDSNVIPAPEYVSELGGQKVFVKGDLATLADGTIAGSVAKMNDVLKNFCANTGLDVAAGVELVTKNPARELGIYDVLGSLEVGKAADITLFDDSFNIVTTFIRGT